MDFTNHKMAPLFTINGRTVYMTQSIFGTWVVMGILIAFTIFVRIYMRRKHFQDVPKTGSLQNVLELAVESMHNMAASNAGKDLDWLGGYFFGVFAYILLCNYAPLLKLRPPTADIATTIPLALNTFLLIHVLGLVRRKGEYLKDFVKPVFLFLPIHIIGELARPLSLSFRLFGNILGGMIMMDLLYISLPIFLRIALPDAIHLYLDVFVGALQAFIFSVLSMTFIRERASLEEE
ncbi:MAG: F0F1 ATP synthase subunit A [Clostridiales bacterium]|jgi:F-type H+-transporting ATPase subunit a|nr:F0F1 ATP synthase subunit A [Clostridiales bacterium]